MAALRMAMNYSIRSVADSNLLSGAAIHVIHLFKGGILNSFRYRHPLGVNILNKFCRHQEKLA